MRRKEKIERVEKRKIEIPITLIIGLWIALSSSQLEAAFANYRFWESTGFGLGLILIRFTNITQFLLISLGMLLVGMLCYLSIEFYDSINVSSTLIIGYSRNLWWDDLTSEFLNDSLTISH